MPALGADMTEGTMLEWHVAPGDAVHRGDIVATIDTSKSEMDIEVFEDGVVEELYAQPGAVVPVGGVLARLRSAAGAAGAGPPVAPAAPPAHAPPPVRSPRRRRSRERLHVTPIARRMAAATTGSTCTISAAPGRTARSGWPTSNGPPTAPPSPRRRPPSPARPSPGS